MANIRPLDDRVVIEPIEAEEKLRVESCCPILQKKTREGKGNSHWRGKDVGKWEKG